MADIEGRVTVYESTDGGSGRPEKTFWQFFIKDAEMEIAVNTYNPLIAETVRLAILAGAQTRVTYDTGTKEVSQVRLALTPAPMGP